MPELATFYGIHVRMHFADHAPPHFHAVYAEHEALVAIDDGRYVRGSLPPRAATLVEEWRAAHVQDLARAWARVAQSEHPGSIDPLR